MQNKKGSVAVIGVIVISVIVLAAVATYVYFSKSLQPGSQSSDQTQSETSDPELTNSDSIEDIDMDLNSTQVDNLDTDVSGITSQVQ